MDINPFETLKIWSFTSLGKVFLEQEEAIFTSVLSTFRGRFLAWMGCVPNPYLATYLSRITPHTEPIIITNTREISSPPQGLVIWNQDMQALPLADECVDGIVLQHCLEFVSFPHEVLREAHRVLVPEGTLMLSGFNPWSLWGMWHLGSHFKKSSPPWQGRFFSPRTIKEWLKFLSFSAFQVKSFFTLPPIQHSNCREKFHFLTQLEHYPALGCGGGFILSAKKRVQKPIPLVMKIEIAQKVASLRA